MANLTIFTETLIKDLSSRLNSLETGSKLTKNINEFPKPELELFITKEATELVNRYSSAIEAITEESLLNVVTDFSKQIIVNLETEFEKPTNLEVPVFKLLNSAIILASLTIDKIIQAQHYHEHTHHHYAHEANDAIAAIGCAIGKSASVTNHAVDTDKLGSMQMANAQAAKEADLFVGKGRGILTAGSAIGGESATVTNDFSLSKGVSQIQPRVNDKKEHSLSVELTRDAVTSITATASAFAFGSGSATVNNTHQHFYEASHKESPRPYSPESLLGAIPVTNPNFTGRTNELIKYLEEYPEHFEAHLNIVALYYKERNIEKVIEHYEILKIYFPENADILHNLACMYHIIGQMEQTEQYYTEALNYNNRAFIQVGFAYYWFDRNNLAQAKERLLKAIALGDDGSGLSYGQIEKPLLDEKLQAELDESDSFNIKPLLMAHYLLLRVGRLQKDDALIAEYLPKFEALVKENPEPINSRLLKYAHEWLDSPSRGSLPQSISCNPQGVSVMSLQLSSSKISDVEFAHGQYTLHFKDNEDKLKVAKFFKEQGHQKHLVLISGETLIVSTTDDELVINDLEEIGYLVSQDADKLRNYVEARNLEANPNQAELDKAMSELQAFEELAEVKEAEKRLTLSYIAAEKFGAAEHRDLGNKGFAEFLSNNPNIAQDLSDLIAEETGRQTGEFWVFKLPNGVKISIGDMVALGGDFLGVPNKPIAHGASLDERKARFMNAYQKLGKMWAITLKGLISIFDEETAAIQKAIKNKTSTHAALSALNKGYRKDIKFTVITGGEYLKLSNQNFDHFGHDAKLAYEAGHTLAMETAQAAALIDEPQLKALYLMRAILLEAFACHFLTDLFSTGHIRTPRKALYDALKANGSYFASERASYMALTMHEEDNEKGLWVHSEKHPEPWLAHGDDCLDEQTDDAKKHIVEAVTAAFEDVAKAYYNPQAKLTYSYAKHLPQPYASALHEAGLTYDANHLNHVPLYRVEAGEIITREKALAAEAAANPSPTKESSRFAAWKIKHRFHLFGHSEAMSTTEEQEIHDMHQELDARGHNCRH